MGRETVVVIIGAIVGGAWVGKDEGEVWKLMVFFVMLLLLMVGEGEVDACKRWPSDSSSLLRRRPDAAAKLGFLYFATALCTSCRDSHRPPAPATAARCSGSSAPLTTCATVATL